MSDTGIVTSLSHGVKLVVPDMNDPAFVPDRSEYFANQGSELLEMTSVPKWVKTAFKRVYRRLGVDLAEEFSSPPGEGAVAATFGLEGLETLRGQEEIHEWIEVVEEVEVLSDLSARVEQSLADFMEDLRFTVSDHWIHSGRTRWQIRCGEEAVKILGGAATQFKVSRSVLTQVCVLEGMRTMPGINREFAEMARETFEKLVEEYKRRTTELRVRVEFAKRL